MQKGLFDALFVIIMLALFSPTVMLNHRSQVVNDVSSQLNGVSFAVDSIVADGLSDATFNNNCVLTFVGNYDLIISSYISNYDLTRSGLSSVACSYSAPVSTLVGVTYSGYLDISCSNSNDLVSIAITKRINFDKEINPTLIGIDCNIKIIDNFNSGFAQVDLNGTI